MKILKRWGGHLSLHSVLSAIDRYTQEVPQMDYGADRQVKRALFNVRELVLDLPTFEDLHEDNTESFSIDFWIDDRTEVVCPKCGQSYSDEIFFMGEILRCPSCGQLLVQEG